MALTDQATIQAWGSSVLTNAQSLTDGASNSTAIINTGGIGSNAALTCQQYSVTVGSATYTNWYLPAICEMGGSGEGAGCSGSTANMVTNLSAYLPSGNYWSSTEFSAVPTSNAWYQFFNGAGGSAQVTVGKINPLKVRCVRTLTQ
jgi:hypothetical protein